jgi:hypothetical protein
MKRNYKHTEIIYWIKEAGSESNDEYTIRFENRLFENVDEVEELFDYGNELNYLIENHRNDSKYGILDNYGVIKLNKLTDCDLGAKLFLEHNKNKMIKQSSENFKNESFWLSPNGVFYYVSVLGHEEVALNIIRNKFNLKSFKVYDFIGDDCQYAYEYLESIGYIRFCGWSSKSEFLPCKINITYKQYKILKDFCLMFNYKFPVDRIINLNEIEKYYATLQ